MKSLNIHMNISVHFSYFSDLNKFQEGIGEKIGMCVFFMTIFSANIINAFYHGWQLTLVMMAPMPVSSILHISIFKYARRFRLR